LASLNVFYTRSILNDKTTCLLIYCYLVKHSQMGKKTFLKILLVLGGILWGLEIFAQSAPEVVEPTSPCYNRPLIIREALEVAQGVSINLRNYPCDKQCPGIYKYEKGTRPFVVDCSSHRCNGEITLSPTNRVAGFNFKGDLKVSYGPLVSVRDGEEIQFDIRACRTPFGFFVEGYNSKHGWDGLLRIELEGLPDNWLTKR